MAGQVRSSPWIYPQRPHSDDADDVSAKVSFLFLLKVLIAATTSACDKPSVSIVHTLEFCSSDVASNS